MARATGVLALLGALLALSGCGERTVLFLGPSGVQWGVGDPGADPATHPNWVDMAGERLAPWFPVANAGCGGAVAEHFLAPDHPLYLPVARCGARVDGGAVEDDGLLVPIPPGETVWSVRVEPHLAAARFAGVMFGVNTASWCLARAATGEPGFETAPVCLDAYRDALAGVVERLLDGGLERVIVASPPPAPAHYVGATACLDDPSCPPFQQFVAGVVAFDLAIRPQMPARVEQVVASFPDGRVERGPGFHGILDPVLHFDPPGAGCCDSHAWTAAHVLQADAFFDVFVGRPPAGWD